MCRARQSGNHAESTLWVTGNIEFDDGRDNGIHGRLGIEADGGGGLGNRGLRLHIADIVRGAGNKLIRYAVLRILKGERSQRCGLGNDVPGRSAGNAPPNVVVAHARQVVCARPGQIDRLLRRELRQRIHRGEGRLRVHLCSCLCAVRDRFPVAGPIIGAHAELDPVVVAGAGEVAIGALGLIAPHLPTAAVDAVPGVVAVDAGGRTAAGSTVKPPQVVRNGTSDEGRQRVEAGHRRQRVALNRVVNVDKGNAARFTGRGRHRQRPLLAFSSPMISRPLFGWLPFTQAATGAVASP